MKKVYFIRAAEEHVRITHGFEYIKNDLVKFGYETIEVSEAQAMKDLRQFDAPAIYVGARQNAALIQREEQKGTLLYHTKAPEGEGFYIATLAKRVFVVVGGNETGALYGCLELVERIVDERDLPHEIYYGDAPVVKLRGPVVPLQLTKIEPPRKTYEYPITPGRFPWFYDKACWLRFLELLVWQRSNVLYIWSGHPFSSLIKLPEYPEALEVTEEEYALNREMFSWLANECNRRGIWLVMKFYNIHIPYPFAIHHGLNPLQSDIDPFVGEYTYKCIVEFIKSFPHIGLMVCLGEALRGQQNKTDWFLDTILPAVKEGVKQAGLTEEPPLILRAHDCDADTILREAMKVYSNFYTMWKYNGESLTTYLPTGEWQEIHQALASHGQPHIMNIHVLANLEPFRFAAPSFIQKCMQAGIDRLGGSGLHLYPLFYWDWPYSPDKRTPRLEQSNRDWVWFKSWFRYAWDPNRNERDERRYWAETLASRFDCGLAAGRLILEALEAAGECGPRILRRVGITEGNRQTMSLGMLMTQITHSSKFRPNLQLWESVSTPGEHPETYVRKELAGQEHWGETPQDLVDEVGYYADRAWEKISAARDNIMRSQEEFDYIVSDIKAIRLMSLSYTKKIEAAVKIMLYKGTMNEELQGEFQLLDDARDLLEESLQYYRELAELTEQTYLYANSMQTPQRKIPLPDGEAYGHWTQCLPVYEKEFANFDKHLAELKQGIYPRQEEPEACEPLVNAPFINHSAEDYPEYILDKGISVFSDITCRIQACAKEVRGLKGLQLHRKKAETEGATITLEFPQDVKVLIGYFNTKGKNNAYLKVPDLETNTHADERGGLSVVYGEALKVEGCPSVNVHAFNYEAGTHRIFLDVGSFVFLGVIPGDTKLVARNAGLAGDTPEMLDWMFEE